MYGLPQAGRVASDHLIPRLTAAGYQEAGRTPGLFCHTTNGTIFVLVVDDFLVHYTSEEALRHLTTTLKEHYTITVDPHATKFCGMNLDWNYAAGHVTLSMPGYVEKAYNGSCTRTLPNPNTRHTSGHRQITGPVYNTLIPTTTPAP